MQSFIINITFNVFTRKTVKKLFGIYFDTKVTDLEIGITPGLVFFPTNKVGLEASFGFVGFSYRTSKTDLGGGDELKISDSTFGLNANSIRPNFSLGFRYYLTK